MPRKAKEDERTKIPVEVDLAHNYFAFDHRSLSIPEMREELDKLEELVDGDENARIHIGAISCGYDGADLDARLSYTRWETDTEWNKRVEKQQKRRKEEAEKRRAKKAKQEAEEFAEYQRLQKKFSGKRHG